MNIKSIVKRMLPSSVFSFIKRLYNIYISRLYEKLHMLINSTPEIQELFPQEDLNNHYVYEPMRQTREHPDLFINQIRYYRIYKFFLEYYPQLFDNNIAVADIGDTSGILLRAMRRRGLSVNINPDVVEFIKKSGIEAEVGDIEQLPFGDKSFEYTFCFECIEHIPNPVQALKELRRVTKKRIFLSIPYVERTIIYDLDYWKNLKMLDINKGGWSESSVRDVDCHVFEFSTADFKKIISYAFLRFCDNFPINYFKPLGLTHKNEGSYFNFFILEPL